MPITTLEGMEAENKRNLRSRSKEIGYSAMSTGNSDNGKTETGN